MFSKTTIAESTSIPTAKEIPANETPFSVLSSPAIIMKVPNTLRGIETAIISVEVSERKKINKIPQAKNAPTIILPLTKSIACVI